MKKIFWKSDFFNMECDRMRVAYLFILRSMGISPKGEPRENERPSQQGSLTLKSSVFEENEMIPTKYTCEGENVNPPLEFINIPEAAKSLALLVHDSDAPIPGGWTHWIVFNIDPMINRKIAENSVPEGAIEGTTNFGLPGYGGPCPPSGTHHYEFRLYAIDSMLSLDENAKKADLEHALEGHVLAVTNLIGLYEKQGK